MQEALISAAKMPKQHEKSMTSGYETTTALQSAALLHHFQQQQQQQQTDFMNQQNLLNAHEYLFQLSRENPMFLAELLSYRGGGQPGGVNFQLMQKAAMAAAAAAAMANSMLPKQPRDSLSTTVTNEPTPLPPPPPPDETGFTNISAKKHKSSLNGTVRQHHHHEFRIHAMSSNSSELSPDEETSRVKNVMTGQQTAVKRPFLKFSMDSILSGGESAKSVSSPSVSSVSSTSSYSAAAADYYRSSSPARKIPCSDSSNNSRLAMPSSLKRELNDNQNHHHHQPSSSSSSPPYRIQLNYASMMSTGVSAAASSVPSSLRSNGNSSLPETVNPYMSGPGRQQQLYGLGIVINHYSLLNLIVQNRIRFFLFNADQHHLKLTTFNFQKTKLWFLLS
jgi:hypothetical protein